MGWHVRADGGGDDAAAARTNKHFACNIGRTIVEQMPENAGTNQKRKEFGF